MMNYYEYIKPLLFMMPPEQAHHFTITMLSRGWIPPLSDVQDDKLATVCCGMAFNSPIGLAAGFDKNAQTLPYIYDHGFGFAEIGTITPLAQSGNPKPRMFRLKEDISVINRLGFNNQGAGSALSRIMDYRDELAAPLGINIGKNKNTEDALDDYLPLLSAVYDHADYITVNISSPNTAGLRALQEREHFEAFMKAIMQERNGIAAYRKFRRPVFVKIAPDMEHGSLESLLDVLLDYQVDGVIISNTTISRPATLQNKYKQETGGLSGKALTSLALETLSTAYIYTKGAIPIIGVGGIMNGEDAVARIRAGASLIQLYTGLVYKGFGLVQEIKKALLSEMEKEQVSHIDELVGMEHK